MSTTPNWIIGPTTRCVTLIGEEVKIASVLYHSVFAFSRLEPLLIAARRQLQQAHRPVVEIDQLIAINKTLGSWAQELERDDYQAVNAHYLIGLWTTVEVAVEDTATLIIMNDPGALANVKAAGVKPRKTLSAQNEADARRIYGVFERYCREGRNAAEACCHLLSVLGVTVTITAESSVALSELNYVRNCFLHRGGVIDDRAVLEAPQLNLALGTKIRLSEVMSKRYLKAVSDFAQALMKGVFESRHITFADEKS